MICSDSAPLNANSNSKWPCKLQLSSRKRKIDLPLRLFLREPLTPRILLISSQTLLQHRKNQEPLIVFPHQPRPPTKKDKKPQPSSQQLKKRHQRWKLRWR